MTYARTTAVQYPAEVKHMVVRARVVSRSLSVPVNFSGEHDDTVSAELESSTRAFL